MIIEHGETLISDEIFTRLFVCNLGKCKGACCIEGDSGAPLNQDEVDKIQNNLDKVKPFMSQKGLELLNEEGYVEDEGLGLATTCSKTGECVFAVQDNGILSCAIELSHKAGESDFVKPISCHLYPIRLGKAGDFITLNYHEWNICSDACSLGEELKVPVFRFLKNALIRRFGEKWYLELEEIYEAYSAQLDQP